MCVCVVKDAVGKGKYVNSHTLTQFQTNASVPAQGFMLRLCCPSDRLQPWATRGHPSFHAALVVGSRSKKVQN